MIQLTKWLLPEKVWSLWFVPYRACWFSV